MQPLDQEQKYFLDMLCKFSGKTNKIQVISTYEKPVLYQISKIESRIIQKRILTNQQWISKWNLMIKKGDQEVNQNYVKQCKIEKQFQSVQMALGLSVIGISGAVIMTPVTKSIMKSSFKLVGLSMVAGFVHFKYYQYQYFEWLTNRYVQVLTKKS